MEDIDICEHFQFDHSRIIFYYFYYFYFFVILDLTRYYGKVCSKITVIIFETKGEFPIIFWNQMFSKRPLIDILGRFSADFRKTIKYPEFSISWPWWLMTPTDPWVPEPLNRKVSSLHGSFNDRLSSDYRLLIIDCRVIKDSL